LVPEIDTRCLRHVEQSQLERLVCSHIGKRDVHVEPLRREHKRCCLFVEANGRTEHPSIRPKVSRLPSGDEHFRRLELRAAEFANYPKSSRKRGVRKMGNAFSPACLVYRVPKDDDLGVRFQMDDGTAIDNP